MNKYLLAPSIIAADFLHLDQVVSDCKTAGADWLHVDVMDGHFVPNLTVGPLVVEALKRATRLPLDVHLMIEQPERYIEAFAHAGASSITIHAETCPEFLRPLQLIKSFGCRAGITLNPATPVTRIGAALAIVDLVLVLSVSPGFSGQNFIPETIAKVADVRSRLDQHHYFAYLEVDGGINTETLPKMKAAGANVFVAGHAIFSHPQGIPAGIQALRALL